MIMGELLIIGIDPGTTLGYAMLNADKKVLEINSSKELNMSSLIKKSNELGNPLIIGTDKKKIPHFVNKFAAQFNAKIVSPKEDLSVDEKNKLTQDYKLNNHERDALAAALFAYNNYEKLFSKIEYHLKEFDKEIIEKIREMCVKDELSISLSLDLITKPEKEEVKEIKKIIHKDNLKKDLVFLYEKIKKQEKIISLLKKQKQEEKKKNEQIIERDRYLLKKISQLNSDEKAEKLLGLREERIISLSNELKAKDENIDYLQKEMDKIYDFFSDLGENYLVKKIRNLGYEEFMSKNRLLKIKKNDILLVDNIDIANNRILEFLKNKIKIIIYKKGSRNIKDFILIKAEKLKIKEDKHFALADKEGLEMEKKNIDLLKNIIVDYKETRLASIHYNK